VGGNLDRLVRREPVVEGIVRPGLGNLPVLAELAAEVAAGGGQRKGKGARQNMVEGFLLDGVDMHGTGISVDQGIVATVIVLPHAAGTTLAFFHLTMVRTEFTANAPVLEGGEIG